jgi:serine/threonine-protein kinase
LERIGRYSLIEPLGEGGMAKVWVALKDGAADVCVLKQLHVQLEQNSEAAKRFIREANIASQLIHPSIAKIVDAGIEGTRFCLAMEFIPGQTVEAMVKQAKDKGGILPLEISIPIILQSLEALAYAHELRDPDGRRLGIVHRDLSPRNIMLNYAGQVKLIDFGIAKGDVDEYKTAAGVLMGTPYYMSPEQARALPVDRRSDVYTLGAVFFEMLTGKRLVQAKGRAKILMSVARQLAPPVSTVNPNVPQALDPVLAKALSKKPDERYATAEEFAAALRLASGGAAFTAPDVLGAFLRELFPQGEAKAAAMLTRARALLGDAPPVEATRVAGGSDPVMPSPLTRGGADSRTRTGYVDPSHPMVDIGIIDPTRVQSGSYGSITDGQFDPVVSQISSRTTFPPTQSRFPKVAVGILVLLIALVGLLLFRVTQTETTLPQPPPVNEIAGSDQIVVAKPHAPPPPPPPVQPEEAPPPPPPVVSKKKGNPKPPPRVEPPPPPRVEPKTNGVIGELRGRLREVKRSRVRQAAVRLAVDIEKASGRLPAGSKAREAISYEIGRIRFMTEVDDMIDALDQSLTELSRAP